MLLRGGPGIGPPWSLFKSTFWTFRRVGGDQAESMLRGAWFRAADPAKVRVGTTRQLVCHARRLRS